MKKIFFVCLIAPFSLFSQGMDDVEIKPVKVTDNIYYLLGRGGNVGVLIDQNESIIVDDQFAPLTEKILTAIASLTDKPVTHVINTHYHGDHTGGNENLKNKGVNIVAHSNVKKRLGLTFENIVFNRTIEAKSESFWPNMTIEEFEDNNKLKEQVEIIYVPNSHTDGDVFVHFKDSNVIHGGDSFVRYGYPYIDISSGGSIDGLINANKKILEFADSETKIIPGHGELASIEEVEELLNMLTETRLIIKEAKDNGVVLEDLIPQKPLKNYHERWSGSFIDSDIFVQLVYESL